MSVRDTARREAMALITAVEDDALTRRLWESAVSPHFLLARELAAAAAGAILVVAEFRGLPEDEVRAEAALYWSENG